MDKDKNGKPIDVFDRSEFPVIQVPKDEPPILDIVAEVDKVEKNVALYNKIRTVSLKLLKPTDLRFMGESLYLEDKGAEILAIAWGVHASISSVIQDWHEDALGRYYSYTVTGKAFSRKLLRYVEEIGTCSQRDRFFGTVEGKPKELEDVDVNMIKKKAVTNFYNRIIKRVTGLGGLTEDDLKAAGMDTGKIKKVEFREGGKKADAQLSPELMKRRDEIRKMCLELGNGNDAEARKVLEDLSSFKGDGDKIIKARNVTDIRTEKWINKVHAKAQEALDKAIAANEAKKE